MKGFLHLAKSFLVEEDGPTATEYAVMLALIIMVCITMISAIGTKATQSFAYITEHVPIE